MSHDENVSDLLGHAMVALSELSAMLGVREEGEVGEPRKVPDVQVAVAEDDKDVVLGAAKEAVRLCELCCEKMKEENERRDVLDSTLQRVGEFWKLCLTKLAGLIEKQQSDRPVEIRRGSGAVKDTDGDSAMTTALDFLRMMEGGETECGENDFGAEMERSALKILSEIIVLEELLGDNQKNKIEQEAIEAVPDEFVLRERPKPQPQQQGHSVFVEKGTQTDPLSTEELCNMIQANSDKPDASGSDCIVM